jgi:hypothetical protein
MCSRPNQLNAFARENVIVSQQQSLKLRTRSTDIMTVLQVMYQVLHTDNTPAVTVVSGAIVAVSKMTQSQVYVDFVFSTDMTYECLHGTTSLRTSPAAIAYNFRRPDDQIHEIMTCSWDLGWVCEVGLTEKPPP